MKLNTTARYALMAVGDIIKQGGVVRAEDIAGRQGIGSQLEYLLKILQMLVRARILKSKRGPKGGFSLLKLPDKITMLEVMEAINGPVVEQLDVSDEFSTQFELAYQDALGKLRTALGRVKVASLVQ